MEEEARRQNVQGFLENQTPEEKDVLLQAAMAELLREHEVKEAANREAELERERETLLDEGIAWLNEKWGEDPKCPYCSNETWEISGPFSIPIGEVEAFLSPVFQVMCSNCGQTVLVNAVRAGAIEVAGEADQAESDDNGPHK